MGTLIFCPPLWCWNWSKSGLSMWLTAQSCPALMLLNLIDHYCQCNVPEDACWWWWLAESTLPPVSWWQGRTGWERTELGLWEEGVDLDGSCAHQILFPLSDLDPPPDAIQCYYNKRASIDLGRTIRNQVAYRKVKKVFAYLSDSLHIQFWQGIVVNACLIRPLFGKRLP